MDPQAKAELEAIAEKQQSRDPLHALLARPLRPGDYEFDALWVIARSTAWRGFLGIVASGALLGTLLYPIVGTLFGALWAGAIGLVPTLAAISLYMISRGRFSPRFVMSAAGGAAGSGCGLLAIDGSYVLPGFALLTCMTPALFGAIGGWWGAAKALARYHIEEGLGRRQMGKFAIVDMLLLTAWMAIALTVVALAVRAGGPSWPVVGVWLAASLASSGVVAGSVWLLGSRRNRATGSVLHEVRAGSN